MKKELLIYGFSVGLNRGAILLLTPLLLKILTVEDFGLYSYIQLLFQLTAPIVSLNIIVAISREGAEEPGKALYIYNKLLTPLLGITASLSLIAYCFSIFSFQSYFVWILLLAGVESWHNMLLNCFRIKEHHFTFFILSCSKTLGLLVIFIIFYYQTYITEINYYLLLQFCWSFLIGLLFHFLYLKRTQISIPTSINKAIRSSIVLIPHTLALWIIASTGRFFVKSLIGNYELGVYSKFFNVAMVLMVVNGGIGIVIPQQIIQNYSKWITGSLRIQFLFWYSIACSFLYFIILFGIWVDTRYLHLFKIDFQIYSVEFLFVYAGFYLLGFYYIYSNFLFALRKYKTLSIITTSTAVLTIIINYFLIYNYELLGASIGVFATYLIYYLLTFFWSLQYEREIIKKSLDLLFISFTFVFFVATTYLFANYLF